MQDANGTELSIDSVTTVASDDWETYSVNFANISPSQFIEKFAFLLNPSTETEDTIWLDNFTLSKEIASTSTQEELNKFISIYPNPVQESNQIVFELKMENSVKTIDIISIDGKLMETLPVNSNKKTIDMSNYAKGTYIAKITLNDNKTIVSRITK